jgi:hypothetical protein
MSIEDDVRDMLRAQADAITPSDPASRSTSPRQARASATRTRVLAAAAAVVAVALIGAALVAGRGDGGTSVDVGPMATSPPAARTEPLLDAVWPTALASELVAAAPAASRQQYPWGAAAAYLRERLAVEVPEDGFRLVSGDATNAVLEVADGSVDAVVAMQRLGPAEDPVWYVVLSTAADLTIDEPTYDGERVRAAFTSRRAGELTVEIEPGDTSDPVISLEPRTVDAGEVVEVDEQLGDERSAVVRAILRTSGGPVLAEQLVRGPDGQAGPTTTTTPPPPPATADSPPAGVWPWPGDDVEASVLDDPVDTARAYVATRIVDVGATTASEFQAGDARSGEVAFAGEVSTTVSVRVDDDGHWYVVASSSDLLTLHDTGDGTVTARVETAGRLVRSSVVSDAAEDRQEPISVQGGEEYPGLGYTLGRDDVALRELFILDTVDGTTALTEIAFTAYVPCASASGPEELVDAFVAARLRGSGAEGCLSPEARAHYCDADEDPECTEDDLDHTPGPNCLYRCYGGRVVDIEADVHENGAYLMVSYDGEYTGANESLLIEDVGGRWRITSVSTSA